MEDVVLFSPAQQSPVSVGGGGGRGGRNGRGTPVKYLRGEGGGGGREECDTAGEKDLLAFWRPFDVGRE